MLRNRHKISLIILCLLTLSSWANTNAIYPFASKAEANRFQHLTTILRCVVCQNQNLAESNADLALDLKKTIYKSIQSGEKDEAILKSIQARYGDFVLFSPPFKLETIFLWLAPFLMVLLGLIVIHRQFREQG